MTDKATVEMTSPVSGKVIAIARRARRNGRGRFAAGRAGSRRCGRMLPRKCAAAAEKAEASMADQAQVKPRRTLKKSRNAESRARTITHVCARVHHAQGSKPPVASPAVRQRARRNRHQTAIRAGHGSGGTHQPCGSRCLYGVAAASVLGLRGGYAQRDGVEEIKVIGLRRKIAEKMQNSKRRIPHFAYVEEIDMTELEVVAHTSEQDQASRAAKARVCCRS